VTGAWTAVRTYLGPNAPVSLTRNATFSVLSFVISALTAFVVSPLIIRTLGNASYGLISMAGELTVQFALLSFGLRGALNFFIARGLAREDYRELEHTVRTALTILLGLAGLGALILAALLARLPQWFNLNGIAEGEARFSVGLLVVVFLLGFPMSIFSAVLAGMRRYDLDNLMMIVSQLFTAAMVVLALNVWGTLAAVAVAQASGTALRWLLQWLLIRRMRFPVRFLPSRVDTTKARDLFSFGAADLILTLTTAITLQSDLIVIGRITGAAAAGQYQVGRYLGIHLLSLIGAITMTLGSNFTFYHTRNDKPALSALFLNASRYISGIACVLAGVILCYGDSFIALWVGPEFVEGGFWDSGRTILIFMTGAMLARSMGNACSQYFLGVRQLKLFAIVRVIEAVVSLVLSIVLLKWLGLGGVAFAKLVVSVVSHLAFSMPYCCHLLGIPFSRYTLHAIVRPLLVLTGTAGMALLLRQTLPPGSWPMLIAGGGAATLVGCALGWWLIPSAGERREALARARQFRQT
jgi:O-antigen/teichoic acid export membrane protein